MRQKDMDIIDPLDRELGGPWSQMEGLMAVSLHRRLEVRHRVYLERVKRPDRKRRTRRKRNKIGG